MKHNNCRHCFYLYGLKTAASSTLHSASRADKAKNNKAFQVSIKASRGIIALCIQQRMPLENKKINNSISQESKVVQHIFHLHRHLDYSQHLAFNPILQSSSARPATASRIYVCYQQAIHYPNRRIGEYRSSISYDPKHNLGRQRLGISADAASDACFPPIPMARP
jgi:hypothetical protein